MWAEDKLYTYLYQEKSAKKGASNVTSLLFHHIKIYVLSEHQHHHNFPIDEPDLIVDNCGGQNKNGTVIKAATYFCEHKWFKNVNLIFLIKGYTKNICDHMFNLLKIRWHKANVYTFQDSIAILNDQEQVNVIDATNIYFEYNDMLSKFYRQPATGTINKNHLLPFSHNNICRVIMITKRSHNAFVSQCLKNIQKVEIIG